MPCSLKLAVTYRPLIGDDFGIEEPRRCTGALRYFSLIHRNAREVTLDHFPQEAQPRPEQINCSLEERRFFRAHPLGMAIVNKLPVDAQAVSDSDSHLQRPITSREIIKSEHNAVRVSYQIDNFRSIPIHRGTPQALCASRRHPVPGQVIIPLMYGY
jgi:hypothetical protein